MTTYEIVGMDELIETIKTLEKLPQKCVSRSAKAGAKIAMAYAKTHAPVKTGALRSGIALKAERTSTKGKKVYDVTFKSDDRFVKISKQGKRAFYPSSQEFGFLKKNGGGKVEGKHFMRNSLTDNKGQIEETVVRELSNEIDKL